MSDTKQDIKKQDIKDLSERSDTSQSTAQAPVPVTADASRDTAPVIPKILHHIWVGGSPLPPEAVEYRETWRRHHPDWQMRLWTDENLPPMANRVLFDASPNTGHRADILRYEVLHRMGGVYVDTDMECLAPLDPLLGDVQGFIGRIKPRTTDLGEQTVEIAVLGACPAHPLLARVLAEVGPWARAHWNWGPAVRTGPQFFQRQMEAWLREEGARIGAGTPWALFPHERFYPYMWDEPHLAGGPFPGAVAVHHWWGTWTDAGHHASLRPPDGRPRIGIPEGERSLADARRLADNANDFFRLWAVGIARELARRAEEGQEAKALLQRLARDRNDHVRLEALAALEAVRGPKDSEGSDDI